MFPVSNGNDRMAARLQSEAANNQTVNAIVQDRQARQSVQDAYAAARKAEATANARTTNLADTFTVQAPRGPSFTVNMPGPGGATSITRPGYSAPDEPVRTPATPVKRPKPAKDDFGTVSRGTKFSGANAYTGAIRVTGKANTSGSPGAIGGTKGSGSYGYVYNTNLSTGRNELLKVATSYLGTPYKLGGESHTGIDCSGLVQLVYSQLGFKVPTHSAADQGGTGGRGLSKAIPGVRTAFANLVPGDIVAWKNGNHIAIYAGGGKIIEAANPTRGTVLRTMWDNPNNVIGIHVTLAGDGVKAGRQFADDNRRAPGKH